MDKTTTEFVAIWKLIEETLRVEAGQHGIQGDGPRDLLFALAEKNPIIKQNLRDLQQLVNMGEVLDGTGSRVPVVNVTSEAVKRANLIAKLLKDPPKVMPAFKRAVLHVKPNAVLVDVLTQMKELSYSQVPIVSPDGTIKDLLTTDTISRWLADCVSDESTFHKLREARLNEVLAHAEKQQGDAKPFEVIRSETNCSTVLDLFEQAVASGRRLDALIITADGASKGEIVGIITGWDIPTVLQMTSISRLLADAAKQQDNANLFVCEGSNYRIRFDGTEWTVKKSVGAVYLNELLHHPRTKFNSGELINRLTGDNQPAGTVGDDEEEFAATVQGTGSGVDESVATTLGNLNTRIKQIDAELSELEGDGSDVDQHRIAELEEEREKVLRDISHYAGLGGKPRLIKQTADKGDTIRRAIDRCTKDFALSTKKNHPAITKLKEHIRLYITYLTSCEYAPPPEIKWQ